MHGDDARPAAARAQAGTTEGEWVAARLVLLRFPEPGAPQRAPSETSCEVEVWRPVAADDRWD